MYRGVILANNDGKVKHLYESLEAMLDEKPCTLHHGTGTGCTSCSLSLDTEISVGVSGSPCNPYSVQRSKRFHDGNVVEHSMNDTTMTSVIQWYTKFEPHLGITEQVKGFEMRTSTSVQESPLERFPGKK